MSGEQRERMLWLYHVLSDADVGRFYTWSQMEEMKRELESLRELEVAVDQTLRDKILALAARMDRDADEKFYPHEPEQDAYLFDDAARRKMHEFAASLRELVG